MSFLLVVIGCCCLIAANAAHLPEVHENTNTQRVNQEKFEKPPTFNYQEYQKGAQIDPQKVRYQQQQQIDHQNIDEQKARQSRQLAPQPEFEALKQQPSKQVALEDLEKETPQVPRTSKIAKKSLKPNSYLVNEADEEESGIKRQDDSSYLNYVNRNPKVLQQNLGGFVAPTAAGDHLQALNSLLGQTPENQLHGLQQLLASNNANRLYYKDHTPIKEDIIDVPNPAQHQKPNINVLKQALQTLGKTGSNPDALKSLQAQLDATASAHAESIIAQAQQKALEHVKAQHEAIARAQKVAEEAALEQIRAQNEALARAQADAVAAADAKRQQERKEKEENRKAAERRRQQELTRERARIAALAFKQKQEQQEKEAGNKKDEPHTVAQQTRAKNAAKHKKFPTSHNEPAETQNHYFTAPSLLTHYQPQQLTYHQQPTIATLTAYHEPTPSKQTPHHYEPHKSTYNEHEDHAEVSKYYVPPQFTVIGQTKNAHGEPELHYAANYEFGYRIRDYHHGNDFGHKEAKEGETTKGEYHALLPDGRIQTVSYYVDDSGYHADVSYNGGSDPSSSSH